MGDFKLAYFDGRGRAEVLRLTLAAGGKKFEDCRWDGAQFQKEKDKTPYGQLPILVYKGKTYGETKALASFLARECGLAGKTSEEAMRVDEVISLVSGVLDKMAGTMFEKDAAKKATLEKAFAEEVIPKNLGFFEKKLKDSGGAGCCVGSALTTADLAVYDITETILKKNPEALDKFPEIQKMRKAVEGNAKVKAYLSTRKPTDW